MNDTIATIAVALINTAGFLGVAAIGLLNKQSNGRLETKTTAIDTKTASIEQKVDGTATEMREKLVKLESQLAAAHIVVATAVGHAAGVAETKAELK